MNPEVNVTMQQAQAEVEALKMIFPSVRLISGEQLKGGSSCPAEFFAGEAETSCESSAAADALNEKKQITKLEFTGSGIFQVIAQYIEIDSSPYVIEMVKKLPDDSLVYYLGGREDASAKLARSRSEIYMDALTGAYSRHYYEEFMKNALTSAGVVMIDLDDFTLYNDNCGHEAGDDILKTTADTIRRCIRATDILVRYGGDEFLLIMPGITEDRFTQQLRYLKRCIHKSDIQGNSAMKLSVSVGGVLAENEPLADAVTRADKNMYLAKNRKNAVVTDDSKLSGKNAERLNIMIVDDSSLNREILSSMLSSEFNILEAPDGETCLSMLETYGTDISIVLLDIVMPGISGFEVLKVMNADHLIEDIPVIMISSDNSDSSVREAYEMGVSDYISRPFDSKVVYHRVFNTIKLYSKQRRLVKLVTDQINEKEKNNSMMIGILSQIVEFRNGESGLHVIHIRTLTEMLMEQLVRKTDKYHLDASTRMLIPTASALHDIGKIGIDDKILNKPGKLTKEEFEIMKTHTVIGAQMIESLEQYQNEELIKVAHEICRWHHERWDGRGYPDGLKGDEIPISAQIVSLADVYDALVSERVYKKALPHETAIQMILNGECGKFNPILLDCLIDINQDIKKQFNT